MKFEISESSTPNYPQHRRVQISLSLVLLLNALKCLGKFSSLKQIYCIYFQ